MLKPKTVRFTEEWLSKLPLAPDEGELVTCPACLGQQPLIYEEEQPTEYSWGYVECDREYVLAVVEGRVLADTPMVRQNPAGVESVDFCGQSRHTHRP